MGRLTKNYSGDYCAEDVNEWEITCKLGHLEDLEDELGIPLEVLFKALKDGIKVKTYDDDIEEEVIIDFEPKELVFDYVLRAITTGADYIKYIFDFEDYGKTWSLTKEELE